MKAARTAFCLPIVKVTAGNSVRLLSVFDGSGFLPRRCCSIATATCNCSSSWSLRCLIAAGRSLGRTCREDAAEFSIGGVVGVGVSAACSRGGSVEKKLGIIGVVRPLAMWLSCRPRREGAIDLGSQNLDFRALRGRQPMPHLYNALRSSHAGQIRKTGRPRVKNPPPRGRPMGSKNLRRLVSMPISFTWIFQVALPSPTVWRTSKPSNWG